MEEYLGNIILAIREMGSDFDKFVVIDKIELHKWWTEDGKDQPHLHKCVK